MAEQVKPSDEKPKADKLPETSAASASDAAASPRHYFGDDELFYASVPV